VEVLTALTGATSVRLLLWNEDAQDWFLPACDGQDGRAPEALRVGAAGAAEMICLSAFRYAERTREPLVVPDATRDDRFARDPYLRGLAECALLLVPILTRGEPTAMLLLENRSSRGAFGANRLDTVLLIAGQLSVSLDNALVYAALERRVAERTEELRAVNEKLELLAVTDPLTGLANRRRLAETLEVEWRRAVRPRLPLAVAMVDIDHFKLYNDHYGHPAGDECLRRVATAISGAIRDTDLVARYGGEEFAIVLSGADAGVAGRIAERVRAAVAELAEPHELAGPGIVTVSVGAAATVPTQMTTPEQLIKTADGELYEVKRSGRNRVSVASPG
jgi:diguanylate cyclase (GGDEF)-like protein